MNELLQNIEKIHTTPMGIDRILRNLKLDDIDVVEYCKQFLNHTNTIITRQGKNWYAKKDNIILTINAYSYTIITAHIVK
ncbi:MAG: DUF3781 domain-containing protein [Anaeroplasmataceae bacterium]|nr:DUF3781 domain-containing protein [Anaeroplasmataceae bacterium]MDE7384727.1 DUF3781 domain-containing protein [Anaeroplasmataceae bacterium]